jgi:hypothetical protein
MPDEIQNGQEELQAQGEETPEVLSTSEEPVVEGLPDDSSERTREQFEKLKAHNAELKKQLEAKEQQERSTIPSPLQAHMSLPVPEVQPEVRQQYQQPVYQQPPVQEPQLMDEQGYVNGDVLTAQLKKAQEAEQRAQEALRRAQEAEARVSQFEINQETRELYQAYPELDPSSQVFDRDAYDLVANELTSQIVKSGRRDAMGAAAKMQKYFRKTTPQQEKVLEQRAQVVTPSAGSVTQTSASADLDYDSLKKRSRYDANALYERLERNGY